ncbi:MAG: Gfo/Idh/MocA family oxidoreductase [Candidatus Omnitrophota bacterium]|nr:Gfo/Idh/MocA family oxidoreductase [Candidatus Omnitrophota bacterium]
MLKIAQIGIGSWGRNLLRNFAALSDSQVTLCCDQNKKVLESIKAQYNNKIKVTTRFDDILEDPDIDAVVVATLPQTHAHFAIKALSSGKHVFVEKPLSLDIADAEKMIKAAERNKRLLMVGHLLLYHPAVRKLKGYIEQGYLGDVRYLYSTRVNLGQVREMENALWSLTAHDISVAMYLSNKKPLKVSATGKAYLRKNIQDVVFLNISFKDNVIAHIHASWLDPHKIRKFTVVGSKKMAVFDDMDPAEKIRIYDKGYDWQKNVGTYDTFLTLREGDINIPRVDMVEPLKLECQHFVDCIRDRKRPFTDGESGLSVLKVLKAAQESLELDGVPVKIK